MGRSCLLAFSSVQGAARQYIYLETIKNTNTIFTKPQLHKLPGFNNPLQYSLKTPPGLDHLTHKMSVSQSQRLDRSSSTNHSLLSDSSEGSVADEVQRLNEDVIEQMLQEDDAIAGNTIMRTLTSRDRDEEAPEPPPTPLQRRRSTIVESIKSTGAYQKIAKMGFWDSDFKKQRANIYITFLKNYIILALIFSIALSVMWGTYHKRENYYHNMKILVVNDDQQVNGVPPIVGQSVNYTAFQVPGIHAIGAWRVFDHDAFAPQAAKHNNTFKEEAIRLVHHQKYWAAIYIPENITYDLYTAIQNNDTSFNLTGQIEVLYETGRDLVSVSSYVVTFCQQFEEAFVQVIKGQYGTLVNSFDSNEDKVSTLRWLAAPPTFVFTDMRPAAAILAAPFQLGLSYLVVFTFFQMLMTIRIQIYLASVVHGAKFILVKVLVSQLSYLTLAASFVVLNVTFKIDVTSAFGHSGGLVLLAVAYLLIGSLGTLNEIAATILFTYYPPLIGGWVVLLMAFNVAPTTSPMALTYPFYRYGYAMPIHNAFELVKVVFCNTYKGQMGRNIGILFVWIVWTNIALPFVLLHVSKVRAKREKRAKEKAEAEQAK